MRKILVVANWKCNPTTLQEAKQLFNSIKKGIKNARPERSRKVEVVICPPFVHLPLLAGQDPSSAVSFGGQSCFWEESGAYTGEISPSMLKNLGCQYVIIGHSERRKLGETDEMINKKVKAALRENLRPILCVGDKSRKSKDDIKEIESQLRTSLAGIKNQDLKDLIIAYEPVWAISTTRGGIAATPKDALAGAAFIRNAVAKLFGRAPAQKIRVLYGGSVDSQNVQSFISRAKMAGVLVGRASLDAQEFIKIINSLRNP